MKLNALSSLIIGAAIEVHNHLGPGLLESVYSRCLQRELREKGLVVVAEVPVPIYYKGEKIQEEGFRIDLLVENTIVVELKSVKKIEDIHKKQLLTYLNLAKKPLGLLINFNVKLLRVGITRIAAQPLQSE